MNSKFDYDLLSAMMTNANMGWWEADLKTESYICSEYISRLLGLDEDGTISFKDFNKRILKEEQRHTTTHSFDNIRQTQETVYLLNTVEGPTWIRSKICLQRTDENGNVKVYGIAETQDGPDMSSASQALQERNRLLHNIYKYLPVGIELYNREGILIDMNDKEQEMFHLKQKEDLLGINIFENPIFPEEMKSKLRKHENADFTFRYDFSKIGNYYKTQKKTGTIDLVTKVTSLYDDNHNLTNYLLINADKTETTVAYNKIQEFESHFELIGDYAKVGYANYDLLNEQGYAQRSWYKNLGEKTETPLSEIIGTYNHLHPDDRTIMLDFLQNVKRGLYTLENGNFADEYHTFSCDWQPGKITWYVDGIKYHETSDWFTAVEGETEVAYPAPFDQPFYMILNLAVGGSWVGYPDDDADYINTQSYSIDYVKVYQKDSYNEDVEKPVNEVIIRDPDANGNYVNNGDFAKAEDLTDDIDWKFLTALEGEGNAVIKNKAIEIHIDKAGTVDYSIQLVQPSIPAEKGGEYTVTFDAWADEARTMKVDVSAPDRSYKRYLNDTVVDLKTGKQTYTYTYTMTDKPDANARLEFNFGATDSTATVYITNVSIKKTAHKEIDNSKKPLSDGNYIYNGGFQEGKNRLGDWTVTNNCQAVVSVTGLADGRRLMVKTDTKNKADVILSQDGLPLNVETEYALSFDAQADTDMQLDVVIAGETFTADVTTDKQTFNYVFKTPEELTDAFKTITYFLGNKGTIYLDNVRVVENTLIKNGSFKAGFSGYEVYAEGSTDVSYVVDSQTEDYAADFTIKDTGAQDWMIQLKQNNISLEEGQWYRLSLKAKSDMNRKLMVALQRDGSSDDDWTPYSGSKTVDLTDEYQSIVVEFKMKNKSDPRTILSISMGAVGDVQIKQQHRICIDDIILEKIDAPKVDETESDVNLIKNADFSEGDNGLSNWEGGIMGDAVGTQTVDKGVITYELSDAGTADWNVQLKQMGLALENGKTYEASITLKSTEARTVLLNFMSNSYKWYGGETIVLPKNEEVVKTITFTMNEETDTDAGFFLSMGKIADVDTPASTITVSNISLKKLAE